MTFLIIGTKMINLIDKAINKISQIYMNKGESYDNTYYETNHLQHVNSWYGSITKTYYKYLAKYCMIKPTKTSPNSKILDIGCGVGILVEQFKKLGYDVAGVDVNSAAINNSLVPNNCFLVNTTAKLDYPDNNFDLVVSREVLEHIELSEIDNCIEEYKRVSKNKMIHIIAVTERGPSAIDDPAHVNVQTEEWWQNKFQEHGYKVTIKPTKLFISPFGTTGYFMLEK